MAPRLLTEMQASAPALPGTWKLAPGRVVTLEPSEAGMLRIAHGRVWATFDGPHRGPANNLGDHVIGVGEQLRLHAGQRLVVEAWNGDAPAYFSWDPLPVRERARTPALARVMQPLADLRLAAVFGAGAAARLAAGLGLVAWELVAWRPRAGFGEPACPDAAG